MDKPIAEVLLSCGRLWLVVKGVFIVMEGTQCYDPDIPYDEEGRPIWNRESLHYTADVINGVRVMDR